jgi:hypothetical protein
MRSLPECHEQSRGGGAAHDRQNFATLIAHFGASDRVILAGQNTGLEVIGSALGNVRFGSKADIGAPPGDVPPKADIG